MADFVHQLSQKTLAAGRNHILFFLIVCIIIRVLSLQIMDQISQLDLH